MNKNKENKEKAVVIFRTWRGGIGKGDIIALFPEIPGSKLSLCSSYEHIGQHGSADYGHVMMQTRPSTNPECLDLAKELKDIGYHLVIKRRQTYEMFKIREKTWKMEKDEIEKEPDGDED